MTDHTDVHTPTDTGDRQDARIQAAATLVGTAFFVVGVLGFIPGITTPYDGMKTAGHESHAELFGIFQVSTLHNAVHLLLGVAGIALARTASGARSFLLGGGAVYLALWIYGLLVDKSSQANFMPLNSADDWLHLVLGAAMIALGALLGRHVRTPVTG